MIVPGRGRLWGAARDVGAFVLLAVLIFVMHRGSLDHGLFMDDHAHFRQLQECEWSLSGLAGACRLELFGGVLEAWFMPECTLRFFRPVAFGLMKLTYTLSGWSPLALHVASLGWHLLVCTLLMVLLRQLGAAPLLSWAVAGLFALHPGQVATVQWIACQTELTATAFLLAGTLCYLRFRGWSQPVEQGGLSAARCAWGAACVVFFVAALGCRENAIMFPIVMLSVECLLWRRGTRQAVGLMLVLAVVTVGYFALRGSYLEGVDLPPKPYVIPPGDPDFPRFIFDKACYYLLGEFLLAPSVPFTGVAYLRARLLMFYGLTAVVAGLLVAFYWRYRRERPGLLAPAWLLGFMVPVLPVFAAPHHLYLPGIGWAIVTMQLLRLIGGAATSVTWIRRGTMWACTLLIGVGFGAATLSFGEVMDTAQRVEDLVTSEVASTPEGLKDGDTLYIANLPIIAHYVGLAVERETGVRDLHVHLLTWAPRVLGLVGTDIPSELTWIDERTIEVRVQGDRYFGEPMGTLVADASGQPVPTQTAESLAGHGYRAEVLEVDEEGVMALRFTFDAPLSRSDIRMFWGSRILWACELHPGVRP